MMYGWGFGHPFFGFGGIFMIIPVLLFWALIIGGIAYVVRALGASGRVAVSTQSRSKAIDILEERYAKGEIDTEEYQTKKRELTS